MITFLKCLFLSPKDTEGAPLPLDEKSKGVLSMAVYNDSLFLSGVDVVDYSMLVGFNTKTRRLYVGIIGKQAAHQVQ